MPRGHPKIPMGTGSPCPRGHGPRTYMAHRATARWTCITCERDGAARRNARIRSERSRRRDDEAYYRRLAANPLPYYEGGIT